MDSLLTKSKKATSQNGHRYLNKFNMNHHAHSLCMSDFQRKLTRMINCSIKLHQYHILADFRLILDVCQWPVPVEKIFHPPMTVDLTPQSYSERFSQLGAAIDQEIKVKLEGILEKERQQFELTKSAIQARLTQKRRAATADEVRECLQLYLDDSLADFESFVEANPSVCHTYDVLKSVKQDTCEKLAQRASDFGLKELFQRCCEKGDLVLAGMVSRVWTSRLLDDACDSSTLPPLLAAIDSGNCSLVAFLLDSGADPLSMFEGGNCVHLAISKADPALLESLLARLSAEQMGFLLTQKDQKQVTPLEAAREDFPVGFSLLKDHLLVALSMMGNAMYRATDYAGASARYMEAIQLCEEEDSLVKLEYNLGRSLFRQGKFVDAIRSCSVCLSRDPGYVNAYAQRGQCYAALSNFELAKMDFEKALPASAEKLAEVEALLAQDCYAVLGLRRFADDSAVKSAFRNLAKKFHPDKVMNASEEVKLQSLNQFTRAQTAYQMLTERRHEYDLGLATKEVSQSLDLLNRGRLVFDSRFSTTKSCFI